ncbi:MAG: hypothetical protein OXU61_05485 [Gammaproteobacteria bacterium]|nr:hypothetical protein [Gammaproteobacteria bacterium]
MTPFSGFRRESGRACGPWRDDLARGRPVARPDLWYSLRESGDSNPQWAAMPMTGGGASVRLTLADEAPSRSHSSDL